MRGGESSMSVLTLHHVAVTATDLERSVRFYTHGFGMILESVDALDERLSQSLFGLAGVTGRCAHLRTAQGQRIDVYEFSSPGRRPIIDGFLAPGFQHLSLTVGRIEEIGRKMELEGVEFLAPPCRMPTGEQTVFLKDPDGMVIQLRENNAWTDRAVRLVSPLRTAFARLRRRRSHALAGTALTRTASRD